MALYMSQSFYFFLGRHFVSNGIISSFGKIKYNNEMFYYKILTIHCRKFRNYSK